VPNLALYLFHIDSKLLLFTYLKSSRLGVISAVTTLSIQEKEEGLPMLTELILQNFYNLINIVDHIDLVPILYRFNEQTVSKQSVGAPENIVFRQ
jgi:hypothetical protein